MTFNSKPPMFVPAPDSPDDPICGAHRRNTQGYCEVPARLHVVGADPFFAHHVGRDKHGRWHSWPVARAALEEGTGAAGGRSPFPMPKLTSGYPVDADEAAALRRIVDRDSIDRCDP